MYKFKQNAEISIVESPLVKENSFLTASMEDCPLPNFNEIKDSLPKPVLRSDILSLTDLKEGMIISGVVRNVTDFGAFVDIGVHQDGLVHISELSDDFVKNPQDVVKVGMPVQVRVKGIDVKKNRISLSMKGIK